MDRFITLTGIKAETKRQAIKIGKTMMLKKEFNSLSESEAIGAYMPIFGKIGKVANMHEHIIEGTHSASRIYDFVGDVFYGKVMFALGDKVILKLIIEEKEEKITLFDIKKMEENKKSIRLFGEA